jgi:hypothetical protein
MIQQQHILLPAFAAAITLWLMLSGVLHGTDRPVYLRFLPTSTVTATPTTASTAAVAAPAMAIICVLEPSVCTVSTPHTRMGGSGAGTAACMGAWQLDEVVTLYTSGWQLQHSQHLAQPGLPMVLLLVMCRLGFVHICAFDHLWPLHSTSMGRRPRDTNPKVRPERCLARKV